MRFRLVIEEERPEWKLVNLFLMFYGIVSKVKAEVTNELQNALFAVNVQSWILA